MRKKICLSALVLTIVLLASSVVAQDIDPITIWSDKHQYSPGERGTLYVAFHNERDVAVTIKNITIDYQYWRAHTSDGWVGNETRIVDEPLAAKKTHVFDDIEFTVPADGRAVSTTVQVTTYTDQWPFEITGYGYINVPTTPAYMEQIVTLFTLLVVLVIVCTIIIAATVFLSARRPKVMWREAERAE